MEHMRIGIELVTPEDARRWMASPYVAQRPLHQPYVDFLAEQMARDEFLGRDPIVLGEVQGRPVLLDGQHRLAAVVQAHHSYHLPVTRIAVEHMDDLRDHYITLDTGRSRTLTDVLVEAHWSANKGIQRSLLSAARFLENGFRSVQSNNQRAINYERRSHYAHVTLFSRHEEALRALGAILTEGCRVMAKTPIAAIWILAYETFGPVANDFFLAAGKDDGLVIGDPARVLRDLSRQQYQRSEWAYVSRQVESLWNSWATGLQTKVRPPVRDVTRTVLLVPPGTLPGRIAPGANNQPNQFRREEMRA